MGDGEDREGGGYLAEAVLQQRMTATDDGIVKVSIRRLGDEPRLGVLAQTAQGGSLVRMKTDKSSAEQTGSSTMENTQSHQIRHYPVISDYPLIRKGREEKGKGGIHGSLGSGGDMLDCADWLSIYLR